MLINVNYLDRYYSLLIFQFVHDYLKSQLLFIYIGKITAFFCPRFPAQNWGCGWSLQVQTATNHQPFHPGLCVPLSRCRLPPIISHSTLAYVYHYPGADCHQSSAIPPWPICVSLSRCRLPPVISHSTLAYVYQYPGADCHQSSAIPPWPICVSLSRCRLPPVISHSTLAYVYHYPGADCHQSSAIPPWPICVSLSRCRLPPVISHYTLAYVCHYPGADCHQSSTIPPWPICVPLSRCRLPPVISHSTLAYMCVTIQVQTATSHQPFHPGLYVCHYPGADCHQSSTIPPWPMCTTIQVHTATSHQPFHPGLCVPLSRCILPPAISHSNLAYVYHYPGAYCHQSSTIPPWPMCTTIQGQTATSHQPFHPGLCVPLSRGRQPPVISHSTLAYMCVTIQVQTATSHQPFHPGLCVQLSRGRQPPVINHSTLAYVYHYPGADSHQSSAIPPWPICVSLSRCRLPPAISHSTLAYVYHYPGAYCHQSSAIPPWPMCVSLSRCRLPPVISHSTLAYVCVTIQVQTATSHQPFHPGLCVCHYPGADCHQPSAIPPWPMCTTIQVHTATSHQPFHPGLCVPLSRCILPPVISHSTLTYVYHYPGADCHQSSTIPPWPMCVTIQVHTATSHQPFHPGLCVSLSRCRLPPVINHSNLAYVCHYPGAYCHQSSAIPPWPMCTTIQGPFIPSGWLNHWKGWAMRRNYHRHNLLYTCIDMWGTYYK